MRTVFIIITLFIFFMCGCSIFQKINPFESDYMPLSIGNKWIYNVNPQNDIEELNIEVIREILLIDSIKGKKYFLIKESHIQNDIKKEYYYYQRMLKDTLFTLNYDSTKKEYFEKVDAIFSLNENEEAVIHLSNNSEQFEKDDNKGIKRLPSIKNYKIKVVIKKENTIEYTFTTGMIDWEYTTMYQAGIGMIRSKNAWGIEMILKEYKINY